MGLLTVLPLIKYGLNSAFFIIDPEAIYIGNAVSYIKQHIIFYAEHPGTPSVLMLAFSYWPFRVYAKLIAHQQFVSWVFDNISLVFYYSRFVSFVVFTFSLLIYSFSIFRLTKSILSVIFFELAVMSFSFMPRLGSEVVPETLSFFITAIWVYFFSRFLESKSSIKILILGFISGMAVANKFTNVILIVASLALIFSLKGGFWKQRIKDMFLSLLTFVMGFVLFTWPVRRIYSIIFKWAYQIVSHTGVWGSGEMGFFNWKVYVEAFRNLINSNPVTLVIVLISTFILIYVLISKKIKVNIAILVTFLSSLLVALLFMKFPRIHYILIPYVIIVLTCSVIVNKLPQFLKYMLVVVLLFFFAGNIKNYFSFMNNNIGDSIKLQKYISENSTQKATLWDYGRVRDFVFIWIRDGTQGIFDEDLKLKRPNLLELKSDYETALLDFNTSVDVFKACWDNLYIRTDRGEIFLEKYPDRELKNELVDKSDIMVIKSNHCLR